MSLNFLLSYRVKFLTFFKRGYSSQTNRLFNRILRFPEFHTHVGQLFEGISDIVSVAMCMKTCTVNVLTLVPLEFT